MSNMLNLQLGGKTYRVAIPADEAGKVQNLAAHVDSLLSDLRNTDPNIDRDQMWALVALQLAAKADETSTESDDQAHSVMRFHRELAMRLENLLP